MASEIIVNTIKAPTSGANANKVIIPSGVTLDASAGTLRPSAGAIVQVKNFARTSQINVSSTAAYTTLLSGSITTLYANSIILVQGVFPNYSPNTVGVAWSNSCYLRLKEGSTVVAGFEHPGPINDMEFAQVIPAHYASGQKAVGTYTYSFETRPTVAGDAQYWGRTTDGAPSHSRFSIMEIAQ